MVYVSKLFAHKYVGLYVQNKRKPFNERPASLSEVCTSKAASLVTTESALTSLCFVSGALVHRSQTRRTRCARTRHVASTNIDHLRAALQIYTLRC